MMKIFLLGVLAIFWIVAANKMKTSHFKRLSAIGIKPKENLNLSYVSLKEWAVFASVILGVLMLFIFIVNSDI